MDGFDDLLAPSRSALEENPFEDPFAKRSNSPDPWATPFAQREGLSNDAYRSEYQAERSTTPTTESYIPTDLEERTTSTTTGQLNASADPLDYTAHIDENEDKLLGSPRSPGFKESIPTTFSEIATIRPTESEDQEPSIPTPSDPSHTTTPPIPRPTTPPSEPHSKQASYSESRNVVVSPSPSEWGRSTTVSPLEQAALPGVDKSFAVLALGGEVVGGWQGEQTAWGNDSATSLQRSEEDSDDDKPIGQVAKRINRDRDEAAQENTEPTMSPRMNKGGIQPVFVISVEDPQKVGDPIRSFTMYTVHTRTTSPLFEKSAFSVLRRYSDFRWLYETLSVNNPGVVVPPVPEKNPFGRFDDQFVRQRRFALEKCIQKTANHPILGKDPDLKMFLESDSFALDIKHRKAEIAQERGGLMASIGQSITGPRFYETDEWFDRQKGYLDSLESQLRGLVKAVELVSKHRSELSTIIGEFAQTLGDLSSSDIGKQLSHSLSGLADVERKAQDLQETQSQQDIVTLMSTVDEYTRLINSVRLAFSSRIRTYNAWRASDADLLRVKQTHERNRAQGRIPADRLGYSLNLIADAERRAMDAKHEFDHVSKLIKSEVGRFEQERIEDFKDSLNAFLEGMISRQKQVISAWENYQQQLLKKVDGSRALQNAVGQPVTA